VKVKVLSGGEKNRLLLARIFSQPVNLLVLDEPTNDLDVETLELLEELLMDFKGTVLLVTHDRSFLNNVVTSSLVFETDSDDSFRIREYAGGYDDWLRLGGGFRQGLTELGGELKLDAGRSSQRRDAGVAKEAWQAKKLKQKRDRKLERELAMLPDQLETEEQLLESLHGEMSRPEFYQMAPDEQKKIQGEASAIESRLADLYKRWEELEELIGASD
jgi:ATP-binding cassette subfamily F protein uup